MDLAFNMVSSIKPNNVSGMHLQSRLPCFSLVGWVWDFSSGIFPCFPLAGGLCKLYAIAGGKRLIQLQPLLEQYKHQANPLLSMNIYTPLEMTKLSS
jgi:hypothetical protein